MGPSLETESERLARAWAQHSREWLGDYLVQGPQDPRRNLASVMARHCLLQEASPGRWNDLMAEELLFAEAMNGVARLFDEVADVGELGLVRYGLERGADNVEGLRIPPVLAEVYRRGPRRVDGVEVPDYLNLALEVRLEVDGLPVLSEGVLGIFVGLWREVLQDQVGPRISVIEPACGSANDYRYLAACGLDGLIAYTGFDLCPGNVANARARHPGASFHVGNAFALEAPDRAFDTCVVHDLLEHLSLEGMEAVIGEMCRVSRRAVAVGFFKMDDVPWHVVRETADYHLNTLSRPRVMEAFARRGFTGEIVGLQDLARQRCGGGGGSSNSAASFGWFRREDGNPRG